MLGFLFRTLTARPSQGIAMFDAITARTRAPHWYVDGGVRDTMDGRFAVLATLTALALVRMESDGDDGNAASVALTERFIEVMESEHRELGLGDPTLGKKVRKLVGSLSRRVDLWRETTARDGDWNEAARQSLQSDEPAPGQLGHSVEALRNYWAELGNLELTELTEGKLG